MQPYKSLDRLKDLFCELFQLDTADLDFGLYRLFRLKRAEIEAFLDKQLPAEVDRAFETVTGEERDKLKKQAEQLANLARESVADDAILPSGEPNPKYAETKAVKEYLEARKRLGTAEASEAQRAKRPGVSGGKGKGNRALRGAMGERRLSRQRLRLFGSPVQTADGGG
jgi:adenine-specific DNA-methyltransferase